MIANIKKEKVIEWLKKNASHINLIEWAGKASKKSIFIDLNRNKKFEYSFTNLKSDLKRSPAHIFGASKEEIRRKIKQTNLKKYGCVAPSQNKQIQQKIKQTNLKKYGCENPYQNKDVQRKTQETNLKKYGCKNPFGNKQVQQKIKQTNLKKYGVESPQQNQQIFEKTQETNLKKYGVKNLLQNKKIKEKAKQTKIKNGNLIVVDDKTLLEWAQNEDLGCYTTMLNAFNQKIHPKRTKSGKTILELKVKDFLDRQKIKYVYNKKLLNHVGFKKNYKKPDFLLPEFGLIIECDGEYYHQDKEKDQKRNELYKKLGYDVLCFSGQDILNDWINVEEKILEKIS